jgi:hypothetical protein
VFDLLISILLFLATAVLLLVLYLTIGHPIQ